MREVDVRTLAVPELADARLARLRIGDERAARGDLAYAGWSSSRHGFRLTTSGHACAR